MAKAGHGQHVTCLDSRGQLRNVHRAPSVPVRGNGVVLGILGQMRCLSLGCSSNLNLGAIFVSLGHEPFWEGNHSRVRRGGTLGEKKG